MDPSYMICGNVLQHNHYGEHYECDLKNLKTELTYDLTIPLLGVCVCVCVCMEKVKTLI